MGDKSPIEGSDTAPFTRAERLRSQVSALVVAAVAVLLGAVLAIFVVPQILVWWSRAFVFPYRSKVAHAVVAIGLGEWWAGQLSMLAIRIPDYATALAVGTGIGLVLRVRSQLVAAACGIGMIGASTVASLVFATFPEDPRIAATLIGWDLAVAPVLLIGEILGRRLRRHDAPPPEPTEASSSLAQRVTT